MCEVRSLMFEVCVVSCGVVWCEVCMCGVHVRCGVVCVKARDIMNHGFSLIGSHLCNYLGMNNSLSEMLM